MEEWNGVLSLSYQPASPGDNDDDAWLVGLGSRRVNKFIILGLGTCNSDLYSRLSLASTGSLFPPEVSR